MIPKPLIKKIIRITLGVLCLLIGVIGGFIPVFQGWFFVLLGLILLSKDVPFVRRWMDRLRERFPRQAAAIRNVEMRLAARFKTTVHTVSEKVHDKVDEKKQKIQMIRARRKRRRGSRGRRTPLSDKSKGATP